MARGGIMIFIAIAALLLVIGWFVKYKKITWLISGYNTASKEKQAEYDINKLTKRFGNFMFVLAGSYIVWGLAELLYPQYAEPIIWAGWICSAVIIIVGIIYLNTGNRVKK